MRRRSLYVRDVSKLGTQLDEPIVFAHMILLRNDLNPVRAEGDSKPQSSKCVQRGEPNIKAADPASRLLDANQPHVRAKSAKCLIRRRLAVRHRARLLRQN
jgi:hypothetical protein